MLTSSMISSSPGVLTTPSSEVSQICLFSLHIYSELQPHVSNSGHLDFQRGWVSQINMADLLLSTTHHLTSPAPPLVFSSSVDDASLCPVAQSRNLRVTHDFFTLTPRHQVSHKILPFKVPIPFFSYQLCLAWIIETTLSSFILLISVFALISIQLH